MKLFIFTLLSFFTCQEAQAEFKFYDAPIDYWGQEKKQEHKSSTPVPVQKKSDKFSWKDYHNPKNDEMFREGSHKPPAPMLEVARNPTRENVENYFKWMRLRAKYLARFQNAIKNYLQTKGNKLSTPVRTKLIQQHNSYNKKIHYANSAVISFYFDSHCPYCKSMFKVMEGLQQKGIAVMGKQVDSDRLKYSTSIAYTKANAKELSYIKKLGATGVPFTLIHYKNEKPKGINGYQGENQLLKLLEVNMK